MSKLAARKRRSASSLTPSAARTASSSDLPSARRVRTRSAVTGLTNPLSIILDTTFSTAGVSARTTDGFVSASRIWRMNDGGCGNAARPSPCPLPEYRERVLKRLLLEHPVGDEDGFLALSENFLE